MPSSAAEPTENGATTVSEGVQEQPRAAAKEATAKAAADIADDDEEEEDDDDFVSSFALARHAPLRGGQRALHDRNADVRCVHACHRRKTTKTTRKKRGETRDT